MSIWGKRVDALISPTSRGPSAPLTPVQTYAREVERFVSTIRNTRIVLLALIILGTALIALRLGAFAIPFMVYGAVTALMVHVVLGWLEHSLGLLSGIYMNTRPSVGSKPVA